MSKNNIMNITQEQKTKRLGEEKLNNKGSLMKIIEYNGYDDIVVEFQDEHKSKVHTSYKHFKNMGVKNPYFPTVYNIGYIGDTTTQENNDDKQSYKTWHHMLSRCYSEKYHQKFPTYINCSVCKEWLCYANFEKWYAENYYSVGNERMCLDKDILIKGNKIYSPETCIFSPNRINILFTKCDSRRGELPIGVKFHTIVKKYESVCNDGYSKIIHLGYYDNPTEAFNRYKTYKEDVIKQIANEYKDKIPEKLYNAMINYKVEITD